MVRCRVEGTGFRHRVRWRKAFAGIAGIFCCLGTTWGAGIS